MARKSIANQAPDAAHQFDKSIRGRLNVLSLSLTKGSVAIERAVAVLQSMKISLRSGELEDDDAFVISSILEDYLIDVYNHVQTEKIVLEELEQIAA